MLSAMPALPFFKGSDVFGEYSAPDGAAELLAFVTGHTL